MSIALAGDIVLAGESASFLQAFTRIGLVPDCGSTWFLPRMVGDVRARALVMLADKISAADALQYGLVWKVYADDKLLGEALATAQKMAQMPTRAYDLIKQGLAVSSGNGLGDQLEVEALLQGQAMATEDHRKASPRSCRNFPHSSKDADHVGRAQDRETRPCAVVDHRPPGAANAMNSAVLQGIRAGLEQAQADADVRAVVLTGAGDKAFCAGADLAKGSGSFQFDPSQPHVEFADLLRYAWTTTMPMIARVNGHCLAGGMGLFAMCDMAVAAEHASFGLPEVKIGLFPAQVLAVLQHLSAPRHIAEMCITGEPISAARATPRSAGQPRGAGRRTGCQDRLACSAWRTSRHRGSPRQGDDARRLRHELRAVDQLSGDPDHDAGADGGCEGRPCLLRRKTRPQLDRSLKSLAPAFAGGVAANLGADNRQERDA